VGRVNAVKEEEEEEEEDEREDGCGYGRWDTVCGY